MGVFALHLRETGNIGWRDNFVCITPPVKFFPHHSACNLRIRSCLACVFIELWMHAGVWRVRKMRE